MKKSYTTSLLTVSLLFILAVSSYGQTTIFTESMGTVGGTTTIATHESNNGFDNDAYTMTGGGATNPGDIRATSPSSGYTGASGGANVWFTSTAGSYGFAIEGIDASAYSGLTVQFGYRKESGSALPSIALDYWDGSTYVNVPFTFNEAANAATGWYLSPVISLPTGAQISTLKLRWVKSGSVAARLDDVKLQGTPSSPVINVNPGALTGFNYLEGNGPSTSQTYSLSGSNLTGPNGNITITAPAHYQVSSDDITFVSSYNVAYTAGTLNPTTVYVRLISGLSAGNYNLENITNAGGGATTANVVCSGFVTGGPVIYTWTGATDSDFQVSTNWSPARTSALPNDILQFSNGNTYTITNVPVQTIAKLSVTGGSKITLQAGGANTLTIAGDTGDDLVVSGIGSELNIDGTNALIIALNTGTTGNIAGSMTFTGAAHRLTSVDANSVIFPNGSVFTAGTGFLGSSFGSTYLNSIVFQSGSTYVQLTGSNPFGASGSNTVVVFQPGSLYKYIGTASPSFSGRTYANFELDSPAPFVTVSGTSAVNMDNLTVTNGTLNFNMTGTPGHNIKGNIHVASGAVLSFSPSGAGTVNLGGTGLQTISGTGTISSNANSTIVLNNAAGALLNTAATLNNLTITTGTFTVASGASLITNGTVTGNVTVERYIGAWTSNTSGWHLLSSPVQNQAVAPAFTDGTPANYDFYKWDEVTNTWLNQKEVANGITNFTPGVGYLVAYASSSTKQFTGALNNSDVTANNLTISGGANSGWNLVGNPFASAVQWNDGIVWTVPADIAGIAKIWDEAAAAYTDIDPGEYIPAMNGAMVQVLSNSPASLTIPTAAREHSTTPWLKAEQAAITLIAYDRSGNTAQQSVIRINDQATEGYDRNFDSRFLAGYAPQFYSIAGSDNFSTNTLPNIDNNRIIEMGFVKNNASEFSIGLDADNMIQGLSVYLTDKKTGAVTELREGNEYSFIAEDGDDANRFLVHFSALGIGDPDNSELLSIYSNASGIYIDTEYEKANVVVSNVAGQTVLTSQIHGNGLHMINAASLPEGVYIVSLITQDNSISRKVMINR